MRRRLSSPTAWAPGVLTGILLLSMAPAAFAQFAPKGALPADLANLVPYTGMATTDAYQPPMFPNSWISPSYVFDYRAPRVVYVPVADLFAPTDLSNLMFVGGSFIFHLVYGVVTALVSLWLIRRSVRAQLTA